MKLDDQFESSYDQMDVYLNEQELRFYDYGDLSSFWVKYVHAD